MLICHSCGIPIEKRSRQCHHCHSLVSSHAAVGLLEPEIGNPLKIQLELQPKMLDHLIAADLIKSVNRSKSDSQINTSSIAEKPGNGNGNSHGNGDNPVSGNGHSNGNGDDHVSGNASITEYAQENPFLSLPEKDQPLSTSIASTQSRPTERPTNNFISLDFFAQMPTTHGEEPLLTSTDFPETGSSSIINKNSNHLDKDPLLEVFPATNKLSASTETSTETNTQTGIAANNELDSFPLDGTKNEKNLDSVPVSTTSNNDQDKEKNKLEIPEQKSDPSPADQVKVEDANSLLNAVMANRRSFSGSGSSTKKDASTASDQEVTANNKPAKPDNKQSIFDKIKTAFIPASDSASLNPGYTNPALPGSTKDLLAKLPSSWTTYLAAGLIVIFLLFKGFQTFYVATSSIANHFSNTATAPDGGTSISGRWQFAAKWNTTNCQGQIIIHQRDSQIFGQGIDYNIGQYKFNGTRTGNHLDLLKQYVVDNKFVGHPIELHGDLDPDSKPLFINGQFRIEYMQGGKWRGRAVVIDGNWEAQLVQPLIEEDSASANVPLIRKHDERPSSVFADFFGSLTKTGGWIALGIIIFGIGGWHFASSLIGPDGWLGIWDKQKYVPAQFLSEHKKEKRQLSQPLKAGSLPLGERWEWHAWQKTFPWIPKDLAIPPEMRVNNPHILVLGGGEKGKSRLMAAMIAHDIQSADRAVVLVDSDGGLADLLMRWISVQPNAEELAKRVIVIDPTSNNPSPSFNPLQLPADSNMQNAAAAIVHGFKAIYHEPPGSQNQWSPQTAHILRNSAMLLMANGKTLIDLPTLLQDNDFRDILLENIEKRRHERVEFTTLLETWGQYKRLARTEQWINWYEPILNRVGPTLINLRIRPILTQSKGDIDLEQVIAEKKILLVKIPTGQLHEDANLLGSLIVTGLKQAAISLCTAGGVNDRSVAMYLDEFDNFIEKETLDAITTETKKFHLAFIGATKTLQHLPEDFRNQIVINIGTMCVFALSKKDGDMIGPQMFRVSGRKAKHRTLMNIINKVNTSPQFELISDEEKYNIDRILGQTERQFYAYRVGTVAGVFRMKCHDFNDIPDQKVNHSLVELMYKNR